MEGTIRLEDAQVIATMRAGNVDAYAEIVEHYQIPIVRYLFRLTGDYELARDLAQDTFVKAYKAILKTDSELQLKAWLYRIATNNAFQNRRRRRLLSFISLEDGRKPQSDPGNTDNAPDTLAVQEALGEVPAEQRTCLVLHFVEGFKYWEIALTLGISEEAVRKRVARAKQAFMHAYDGGEDR